MGNEQRVSPQNGGQKSDPATEVPAAVSGQKGPSASEQAGGAGEQTEELSPDKLVLMLEDARSKADQHWDALLRAKAELDNLRKRTERDVEKAHKFGLERFLTELLPVKDSMELGISAASEEGADVSKVREGVELTLKMLATAIEKFGIEEVDPQGEKFDPERHQAMTMQEAAGVEPGTVVSVIQKGYLLNGRLVRPALVIVAKSVAAG